jgi:MFS transporter, DHA1 family, multidrug resistance protein B
MLTALHPNIKWRLLVGFISGVANMMVSPYLVIYFSSKLGSSITGIVYISVILSAVIGSFIGGYISDKIGRKKVLMISEMFIGISFLCIALLNSPFADFPYITAGIFVINMFFNGCFQPVTMALILDCSTRSTREKIFRLNYWVNNLSIAIGSLIGGFLFNHHHFILFLIVASVSFFSVSITIFCLSDEYKPNKVIDYTSRQSSGMMSFVKNYSFIVTNKIFMYYLIGSILIISIEQQLTNYIGIRLVKDISNASLWFININGTGLLGILKSENTILVVLAAFFINRMMKSSNEKLKLLSGVILFTFGYFILAYHNNPFILIIAMFIGTIGELIYVPVKQSILGSIAPDDSRSAYMAVNQISAYFSEIIAGLFIIIGSHFTPLIMALILLTMGLAGTVLYNQMLNKMRGVPYKKGYKQSVG